MKYSLLAILITLMLSCSTIDLETPDMEMARNNRNLLQLDIGMSANQVIEVMGSPNLNEAYESVNGVPTRIYFYYTQRRAQDGNYTKDEMTPVVFEDDRLVGWGSEFYESKQIIEVRNR